MKNQDKESKVNAKIKQHQGEMFGGAHAVFSIANLSTFQSSLSLHYGETRICYALRARVQSGVLFLGYSFGVPAIAADVGTLKEEIVEGQTGFVFKPQDSSDLASVIRKYFESELFRNLETRRIEIKEYANKRYSWDKVAAITTRVYSNLLKS